MSARESAHESRMENHVWRPLQLVRHVPGRVLGLGLPNRPSADPAGDPAHLLAPPEGMRKVPRERLLLDLVVRPLRGRSRAALLRGGRGMRLHLQPVLLAARLRDPASQPRDNSADGARSKFETHRSDSSWSLYDCMSTFGLVESCKLFHDFRGAILIFTVLIHSHGMW